MNIYLLKQSVNTKYDTYDSCVVVANSIEAARQILPSSYEQWGAQWTGWAYKPEQVSVTLIGVADKSYNSEQVICASFNAG